MKKYCDYNSKGQCKRIDFLHLRRHCKNKRGFKKTAGPTGNLVGKIDGLRFGVPEDSKFIGQN